MFTELYQTRIFVSFNSLFSFSWKQNSIAHIFLFACKSCNVSTVVSHPDQFQLNNPSQTADSCNAMMTCLRKKVELLRQWDLVTGVNTAPGTIFLKCKPLIFEAQQIVIEIERNTEL